jgi:hypothetical protein
MNYITVTEASKKWGISSRAILYHIKAGRIEGAEQKGRIWLIPSSAPKPEDLRFSHNQKPQRGEGK